MNTDKNAAMRPSDASLAKAFEYAKGSTFAYPCSSSAVFNTIEQHARELDAAQPAQAGEAVKPWERFDDDLENHVRAATPEETAAIRAAISHPHPQPEQPASAVEWTTDRPRDPGVYRVRGFSIDDASRTGVVEVLHGDGALICNIHRENTDPDHTTWYSVADLNPRFEWQRLVAQSPAVSPPSVVAVSDETVRDALESAQALIGVMFGRSDGSIPATVDTPLSVPVKVRDIARDIDKALESFASRMGSGERDGLRIVAKRNLRSMIEHGSNDKKLMLKCLEELS